MWASFGKPPTTTTRSFGSKSRRVLAASTPCFTMLSVVLARGTIYEYTPHFRERRRATFSLVTVATIKDEGRRDEMSRAVLPVRVLATMALIFSSVVALVAHLAMVLWISVPLNL